MPYPQLNNSESFIAAQNTALEEAQSNGLEIVSKQHDNQLLIDLDTTTIEEFKLRLSLFNALVPIDLWRYWQSKTPGHYHVELFLKKPVSSTESILLQSVLGSDYKRELLAFKGLQFDSNNYSVLFRPVGAEVTEVKLRSMFEQQGKP